jgi:hypothetical protein
VRPVALARYAHSRSKCRAGYTLAFVLAGECSYRRGFSEEILEPIVSPLLPPEEAR